jgi:hypothetical protein
MKHNPFDPNDRRRRFEDADLTRRILDHTSGNGCARAEALLGSRWDGALETVDTDLLAGHLEHCAACRALAATLDRLQPQLARLAERPVDDAFIARVAAATVGLAGAHPRPVPWLDRLAGHLADLAHDLWNRPRFALEAAWTATALAALLMWSPLAPARNPADEAADLVTAGASSAPQAVAWVQQRVVAAEEAISHLLHLSGREAAAELTDLGLAAQQHGARIIDHGRALLERLTDDDHDQTSTPRD